MIRSMFCLFILCFSQSLWAQTKGLDWLFSQPVSVSPSNQSVTYQLKMKLQKKSHIRILNSEMSGPAKYTVSKSMAYTDPSGYIEFLVEIKEPDKPIDVWIVDELSGYAKKFLWQPGTNIDAPPSLIAQSNSANTSVIDWKGAKQEWRNFDRRFSLALNLGPVGYTTEITDTNTALDFNLKVAPRGTMEYWQNIKDSLWALQLRGSLQQVSIQEGDVFAPPSSDSNLLYAGEANAWYQINSRYSLISGLKYQRDVFLARENDGGSTVAALQEQDLGKIRLGSSAKLWKICHHCNSQISAALNMILFSSGDREFDSSMGFELAYDLHWRWKERWQIQTAIGYSFQSYSFSAVDEISSQNLDTESETSELSIGFGMAYLF